ncbi:MAG: hypothetical protein DCF16_00740 [Alphaproteobacteria bacterium]|nr:MAG: hypothetical protein DCF16_00740 [Alphaproteobacteria bacterium]
MRWIGFLFAASLTACVASPVSETQQPRLPTPDEVERYVREHWPSYTERSARFAGRASERPNLEGVRAGTCEPYFGGFDCVFFVTVKFSDDQLLEQRLKSYFVRDANGIRETIVLVHEIPRQRQ